MTLTERLTELNTAAQKHMDENPGDIVGLLVEDTGHWAEYGVYSAEQLNVYLDEAAAYNTRKDDW